MSSWIVLFAALVACGDSSKSDAQDHAEPKPVVEAPAPSTPDAPPLDKAALEKGSTSTALVPSPIETQRALVAAGVQTELSSLIPKHTFKLDASDLEHASVRTGVVLADLLLTVKTADKDVLLERIQAVQTGMKQLEGGDDIQRTLADYATSVKADAISRDELLKEFDELSGAVIPELEFNGQERVVPLIQAGSWLEGANLVAKAVKAKKTPASADSLLKQPAVVKHFTHYVKTEAETPVQVGKQLEASLAKLEAVATQAQPLDDANIDTVIQATQDVLALL